MKVTREQAAENRERILDSAAQLFRERGFDGIGVADLMKAAGLTHGGFYGQFESKEDLVAQACARAMTRSADKWDRLLEGKSPEDGLKALTTSYLSSRHVGDPGSGCALPALGAEAARRDPGVRHAFTQGASALIERITRLMPGSAKAARRRDAIAVLAGMVGAITLARAVDEPKLAEEILQAVRSSI